MTVIHILYVFKPWLSSRTASHRIRISGRMQICRPRPLLSSTAAKSFLIPLCFSLCAELITFVMTLQIHRREHMRRCCAPDWTTWGSPWSHCRCTTLLRRDYGSTLCNDHLKKYQCDSTQHTDYTPCLCCYQRRTP